MTWQRMTRIIMGWTMIAANVSMVTWLFWEANQETYDIAKAWLFGIAICSIPIAVIGIIAGIITLTKRWRWMLFLE